MDFDVSCLLRMSKDGCRKIPLLCAELVGNRGGLNQIEPNDYNFIPPSQLVFSDFSGQALLAPNVRIWFLIHYIPPFLR